MDPSLGGDGHRKLADGRQISAHELIKQTRIERAKAIGNLIARGIRYVFEPSETIAPLRPRPSCEVLSSTPDVPWRHP